MGGCVSLYSVFVSCKTLETEVGFRNKGCMNVLAEQFSLSIADDETDFSTACPARWCRLCRASTATVNALSRFFQHDNRLNGSVLYR
jgi:hypothetical protein